MSISNGFLLNGKYAIPRLMLLPHYYASEFIECDWVIWSRVWYSECLHAYTYENDAKIAFECLHNILNSKSVNIWRPRDLRKRDTYIQTCNKKEKGVFEIHLYKVTFGHDHNMLYVYCKQWNKERGVSFSIGNGSSVIKIY
jgi:hypothetical protein